MKRLLAALAALSAMPAMAAQKVDLAAFVFKPPALSIPLEQIELGRRLFFDRRLSGDGTMNCATCHLVDEGFTDGRRISSAYPTNKHFRNTPTAVNAAYRERLTWDGRAGGVEEQALGPIGNPFEMNLDLDLMEEKLRGIPAYRNDFFKAFGADVSRALVARALAAFEKTLFSGPSPFDRFALGEENAMTPEAKKGMDLFFGKAGCVRCHDGPHFGGHRFENLGLGPDPELSGDPMRAVSLRAFARSMKQTLPLGKEEDWGYGFVTGDQSDRGKFIAPTLRQLANTAPYGHDGRFAGLDEMIDLLDKGGGPAPGRSEKLAPLGLAPEEKTALKEFLLSLTGKDPVVTPPLPAY